MPARVARHRVALALVLALGSSGLATTADELCPPASDPCVVDRAVTLTDGSMIDLGGRALHFGPAARVISAIGLVSIVAGPVRLLPGARITGGTGVAGATLAIESSGGITLEASGNTRSRIDLSAPTIAGGLVLKAQQGIAVAGDLDVEGRDNEADGGVVRLDAGGPVGVTGGLSVKGGSLAGGGSIQILAGGSVDMGSIVDLSGGDFGGGDLAIQSGGDVVLRQDVLAGGGGFSGDGGALLVDAAGTVTVLGAFKAEAAGDSEEGGGSGGEVDISADGDVIVNGQMQLTGGFPDGEGGAVFVQAGGSFIQTAAIQLLGNGIDGCGGSLDVTAGRDATLARVDASGGACGAGDVSAQAFGTLRLGGLITADGTTGFSSGGVVFLRGRDVVANQVVRANGGALAGNGFLFVEACNLTVDPSGELRATGGSQGGTTILASGLVSVRGRLVTSGGGANRIEYRDPALPPVITGSVSPAATVLVNATLPPCPGETAACGDGTLDAGEQCDDGNTTACDGCGASCRQERCGDGRVECAEECDAGALNGQPGSGCDAGCRVIPLPGGLLLLPGGRTRNSCMAEWQIRNPGGAVTDGFPDTTQGCVDGDPACDGDGRIDGSCRFDAAVCTRVTDARLPGCDPGPVESLSINKPNVLDPADATDAVNGAALRDAIAGLGLTVKAGTNILVAGTPSTGRDRCTAPFGITVPHPPGFSGSRTVNIAARDGAGARMRENAVTLVCQPNTAVCGNGTREIGEGCDDGNRSACDGCAAACRVEACGDGIVECAEHCDDGPGNGAPGSGCTTACTEVVPSLRIPGGGSKRTDCLLETAIDLATPDLKKDGTPSNKQSCADDDPTCDFDAAPGTCRFHVWLCFGGGDVRLQCAADAIGSVVLRDPSEKKGDPSLRAALVERLEALPLPLPAGERCTARIEVDVPAGRKGGTLGLRVESPLGDKDTDSIKLDCVPRAR